MLLMLSEQQQERLRAAVREVLQARNLNPYAIHVRYGISRESLTKLVNGIPPSVEVVERFARALNLNVNDWRELCGYPRVGGDVADSRDLLDLAMGRMIREFREKYNAPHLTIRRFGGWDSIRSLEDVERIRQELEDDLQNELAEKQKRSARAGE